MNRHARNSKTRAATRQLFLHAPLRIKEKAYGLRSTWLDKARFMGTDMALPLLLHQRWHAAKDTWRHLQSALAGSVRLLW